MSEKRFVKAAQCMASDVLKRRWPNRYLGRPVVSIDDCIAGLIELGALRRDHIEETNKKVALAYWMLNRLEVKGKKGMAEVNESFYRSSAWRKVRYSVMRDATGCVLCGCKKEDAVPFHVDHIKPRSKYPELALDPMNLRVLCADCNIGKSDSEE